MILRKPDPHPGSLLSKKQTFTVALAGNPNSGKSALFNTLTGASQKVANYAGVTVERKEGSFTSAAGISFTIIDLPGAYSLNAFSPDESITRDVLKGEKEDEPAPDLIVFVVDANNLQRSLRLVMEVRQLGYPAILALNMMDIADKHGLIIDTALLAEKLGMPVVQTVAIRSKGIDDLVSCMEQTALANTTKEIKIFPGSLKPVSRDDINSLLDSVITIPPKSGYFSDKIDTIVLHPILGYIILIAILFGMFQAVYSWAEWPMGIIESGVDSVNIMIRTLLPEGILQSLITDGIIAGVGSVIIFLPQIIILFFFILVLEESGYLPRAAFLLDRIMRSVGLSGRAFIPLLSCFACAIPGIMATRTIGNARDRLATIMVAPLMTCSARLPVYLLIIGAFIPDKNIGPFNMQGLVLFGLYMCGILSAMFIAWIIRVFIGKNQYQPLIMELPRYHIPAVRNILLGLWERAKIFIMRAGTIILALMILLWFLSSFPAAPENAVEPAIRYSFAGQIGQILQIFFEPIGFNWQIAIALIPGMAAREASVAALGTVYALSATGENLNVALTVLIASTWKLPTALSLLAWYVYAPQCLPTIIVTKRETNSWKWAGIITIYLFALAYVAAFITYHTSLLFTGGH